MRTATKPPPKPEASPSKRRRIRPLSQHQPFSAPGPSQTADSTEGYVENEESEGGEEGEEDEMDIDSPLQPDINLGGADEEQAVSTSEPGKFRKYSFQASIRLSRGESEVGVQMSVLI